MIRLPRRPEIDEHTLKLMVGIVALSLANLTTWFSGKRLASISASYYETGLAQTTFIGFLFAAASFFLAYNGQSRREMVASKVAAVAGLGVAIFPCNCPGHPPQPPFHYISAAVLFVALAYLCYCFFGRAWAKGHTQARARGTIYVACGLTMVVTLLVLAVDHFTGEQIKALDPRLTFHGEYICLVAFGISWLTASRILPLVTRPDERISLVGKG